MLITHLKDEVNLTPYIEGKKVFILNCHGCREVYFPDKDAEEFQKSLEEKGLVTGKFTTNFICEAESIKFQLEYYEKKIKDSDAILVFSCGVGVQTVAEVFEDKPVYAACDTIYLPGEQGITPLEHDCDQCGQCYLNLTGGICPMTACSKSLLNGPCGGTKNGKCEVNPDMDCGWERIFKKLFELGRLDEFKAKVQYRNYQSFEATKEHKETVV